MSDPKPETIEAFYALMKGEYRPYPEHPLESLRQRTLPPRTPAQALTWISLRLGQAERFRLNAWVTERLMEARPEDPI